MKPTINYFVLTVLMTGLSILSGCADLDAISKRASDEMKVSMEKVRHEGAPVKKDDAGSGTFLGGRLVQRNDPYANLPALFSEQATPALGRISLISFAEYFSASTGVPVRLMPDVLGTVQAAQATGTQGARTGVAAGGQSADASFICDYAGTRRGLLDLAASRTGTHWRYENGQVVIYRYITKNYVMPVLPGDTSIAMTMQNTAAVGSIGTMGAGGAGASGTVSGATIKTELSPWKAMVDGVQALVGNNGRVVPSQPTSSVMVYTTPEVMSQVDDFMQAQKARYSKQIFFEINFYSLKHTRDAEHAINWNVLFASLTGNKGLNLVSPGAIASGAGMLTANIVRSNANITATLRALNTMGNAAHLLTIPVTASNAQFSQVSNEDLQEYISATQTTQTANVGASTSVTKGLISTGMGLDLLPNLLDNDTVQLQLAFRLAESSPFKTIPIGGNEISNANLSRRTFSQRAFLRNGEMLVLNGFERTLVDSNSSGMLSQTILLGGSSVHTVTRESLIITVRPVIIEGAT